MTTFARNRVFLNMWRTLEGQSADALSDGDLLEQYSRAHDEAAFAMLVRRYSLLVHNVCRRVLQNHHDTEDAFQAVFLVLARRAGSIRRQTSLASWLFAVSHHMAVRARASAAKRRSRELRANAMSQVDSHPQTNPEDLQPMLNEELSRLPERYRAPIVLCYLEGKTRETAAAQLGWSPGELRGKLERGREHLRKRLAKRGIVLTRASMAPVLAAQAASDTVPTGLIRTTIETALQFATDPAAARAVAPTAAALAEGALRTMMTTRLKLVTALLLLLGTVSTAAGFFYQSFAEKPPAEAANPEAAPAKPGAKETPPARSVILLWMAGGPSQIDTFDLKPGHENGGPFKEIDTAARGIRISEHLPKIAQLTDNMVIIRSMTSREGDHVRGSIFMQTGFAPHATIQYPSMGAVLARELGNEQSKLPPFVSVGGAPAVGAGFLDQRYAPVTMTAAEALHHPKLPALEAREAAAARNAYGKTPFGDGCLAARRLVEGGVPFVQVTLGGWDGHANNADLVKRNSQVLDAGWSALMADLRERGLLDTTLIVWMGEFGRTPVINQNAGRDHWSKAFSVVLAGGGIRGGQVIGKTSADGMTIEDRPVTAPELWATIYRLSDVDHTKRHKSNQDIMVSLVEPDTQPIKEVVSPRNQRITELIRLLDAGDFKSRQQATDELEKFGASAIPALRRTAAGKFALETTRRAEALIQRIEISEAQRADATEKKWAALGRDKHALKTRIGKLLQTNPNLDDRQCVAAVYLLTLARSPKTEESVEAEKRIRERCYHSSVFFDLAWELVHGTEFNADVAAANATLLDLQQEYNKSLAERLKLVNSKQVQESLRASAGRLSRAVRTSRDLVDLLFLVSLSRFPTRPEADEVERHLPGGKDDRPAKVQEILGAVISGREFVLGGGS